MLLRWFALLLCAVFCRTALAWSATGHHVISVLAFDLLPAAKQSELMRILATHPDFSLRFNPPRNVTTPPGIDRWRVGIAGCWPDLIRDTPQDRPTWHYDLNSNLTIGSVADVPDGAGPLASGATMATQELYLPQALELCLSVLNDKSQPDSQRAIAVCWILHLVADGHQPCHAGSLYAPEIFPSGDRGGNSIRIGSRGNLHSTWDNLLGGRASASNVLNRVAELKADKQTIERVEAHQAKFASSGTSWTDSQLWLGESRRAAQQFVYTETIKEQVSLGIRGVVNQIRIDQLPEDYLKTAGTVSRIRATQAGYRLAAILNGALP